MNKIHIVYKFKDTPFGGGNQFLKALKKEFLRMGVYTENVEEADIIFFNSHHFLNEVFKLKRKFPEKKFIHRIDGPIQSYRKKDEFIDQAIYKINKLLADGTVFQSKWSLLENKKLFDFQENTIIYNAVDEDIFNRKGKKEFNQQKPKLLSISWSKNRMKGFDTLEYLDNNLDFSSYEMTFLGNSPLAFKNIKKIDPVPSREVGLILKEHDIFVFPSKAEACSNTLIEALSCGLPCLCFNATSNSEVLQRGGELFNSNEEILEKLDKIKNNYYSYQIPSFCLKEKASQYLAFGSDIVQNKERVSVVKYYFIKFLILKGKILNKLWKLKSGRN